LLKGQVAKILEETFTSRQKGENLNKTLSKIDATSSNARFSNNNHGISNQIHFCHISK
jgi:hypothetical protein